MLEIVGPVPNTTTPVPVSSEIAAARAAELPYEPVAPVVPWAPVVP